MTGRPGGLATLKTLVEASTRERPIEAYLFEAYVFEESKEPRHVSTSAVCTVSLTGT
jgi:hypothetical protein